MFRTRAWVPGGSSRGAWAPSLGSLGCLPGGVPAQTLWPTSCPAPIGLASKFMLILMSIFDRLRVDLGSVLGVIFVHFGSLVGQRRSPNRVRTILSSKTLSFTKHHVFQRLFTLFAGPRRPKIDPRRPRSSWIAFCCLLNLGFDF